MSEYKCCYNNVPNVYQAGITRRLKYRDTFMSEYKCCYNNVPQCSADGDRGRMCANTLSCNLEQSGAHPLSMTL